MSISSSYDAFVQELNAAYATENLMVDSIPDLISQASNPDLVASLQTHSEETKQHVSRLDSVFQLLDLTPDGGCATASALVEEVQANVEGADSPEAVDLAIGNGAVKIEYLELGTYSVLRTAVTALHLHDDIATAIDANVAEDSNALTIAENNAPALFKAASE